MADNDVKLNKMKEHMNGLPLSALDPKQAAEQDSYEDTILETESAIHYPVISQEKKQTGFDIRGLA
jgi:hypothetical protein